MQWLPVTAGYTRIRKTAGYAGGYLFQCTFANFTDFQYSDERQEILCCLENIRIIKNSRREAEAIFRPCAPTRGTAIEIVFIAKQ